MLLVHKELDSPRVTGSLRTGSPRVTGARLWCAGISSVAMIPIEAHKKATDVSAFKVSGASLCGS